MLVATYVQRIFVRIRIGMSGVIFLSSNYITIYSDVWWHPVVPQWHLVTSCRASVTSGVTLSLLSILLQLSPLHPRAAHSGGGLGRRTAERAGCWPPQVGVLGSVRPSAPVATPSAGNTLLAVLLDTVPPRASVCWLSLQAGFCCCSHNLTSTANY